MTERPSLPRRALAEGFGTFALVFVGCGAIPALAIGASVGLAAVAFGPLTGASLNSARSFGPALAAAQWQDFWVYVVGPVVGAPLGGLTYQLVRGEHPRPPTFTDPRQADGDSPVRLPA